MKILDLGCGKRKLPKSMGLDKIYVKGVTDIICDLEKGIPIKDSCIDIVLSKNFLEHLNDIITHFKEVERILKNGGIYEIVVPYWTSPLSPWISHKRMFSYESFQAFNQKHRGWESFHRETGLNFKIEKCKIIFANRFPFNLINNLINFFPKFYDRFFSHLLPSIEMYVRLKKP